MIYVMRYKGTGQPSLDEILQKLDAHNITVLDRSALPKMAKVETTNGIDSGLKREWDFFPEKKYRLPTTKKRIKK